MPTPLLPAAALYRQTQCSGAAGAAAAKLLHARWTPGGGVPPPPGISPGMSPSTRVARRATPYGSPRDPFGPQASPNNRDSPNPTQMCFQVLARSPGSVASYKSGSSPRKASQVRFSSPLHSSYDITPYEELYGRHPNLFNFDAYGNMVPPSPIDFASPVTSPVPSPSYGDSGDPTNAGGNLGAQPAPAAMLVGPEGAQGLCIVVYTPKGSPPLLEIVDSDRNI